MSSFSYPLDKPARLSFSCSLDLFLNSLSVQPKIFLDRETAISCLIGSRIESQNLTPICGEEEILFVAQRNLICGTEKSFCGAEEILFVVHRKAKIENTSIGYFKAQQSNQFGFRETIINN